MKLIIRTIFLLFIVQYSFGQTESSDYYWLEDLDSKEVLNWVENQTIKSEDYFKTIKLLPFLESWNQNFQSNRKWKNISKVPPSVEQIGQYAQLVRGNTWGRMPYTDYMKGSRPTFRISINDVHLTDENNLEFDQIICREPDYTNCLILYKKKGHRRLKAIQEFDVKTKRLVVDGFQLPAALSVVEWRDENSVYISTNLENPYAFGKKIRIWNRGESIANAKVLFESDEYDVRVHLINKDGYLFVAKENQAYNVEYYFLENDNLISLDLPRDIKDFRIVSGQFVMQLKGEWQTELQKLSSGSLISVDFKSFLEGKDKFELITNSDSKLVIDKLWNTNDILIVRALEDVQSVLYEWSFNNGRWQSNKVEKPIGENLQVISTHSASNRYYIGQSGFFNSSEFVREANDSIVKYNELIEPIEINQFEVKQWFATAKDGTRVPYFIVHKKGLSMNGNNPVIMTGYGGWGDSQLPFSLNYYSRWIEDEGVFVLSNIRGGGEYGPEWHYSAIKNKRQTAFDDFHAVAKDLIHRNVTKSKKIGIYGTSNGGLLVAISLIQKPELFGAVLTRMGSLELQRCSSIRGVPPSGERGDGSIPEDWNYMKHFSPFHNLEAGKNYPPVLVFASRNDDVSHPCHSRKFVHRMNDLGYNDVYYFESEKGGHGMLDAPNRRELELAFFYKNLHPNYSEIVTKEKN